MQWMLCLFLLAGDSTVRIGSGKDAIEVVTRSHEFSVRTPDEAGVFRERWNIQDLAAKHLAKRDDLGRWAWTGSSWGDGPLTGTVHRLIPSVSGRPRFAIDAFAETEAGGTFPAQLSIWEWNGREAVPLFVKTYLVSLDTEPNTFLDDAIRIVEKGTYRSFSSCGTCPEPEVIRTLRITPTAVVDEGERYTVPEVKALDDLIARIASHRNASSLATPRAIAKLSRLVAHASTFGMLGKAEVRDGVLTLSADDLPCGPLHVRMIEKGERFFVEDVDGTSCANGS